MVSDCFSRPLLSRQRSKRGSLRPRVGKNTHAHCKADDAMWNFPCLSMQAPILPRHMIACHVVHVQLAHVRTRAALRASLLAGCAGCCSRSLKKRGSLRQLVMAQRTHLQLLRSMLRGPSHRTLCPCGLYLLRFLLAPHACMPCVSHVFDRHEDSTRNKGSGSVGELTSCRLATASMP